MKKLLVLGVGNLLLSDDGIGIHAVRELLAAPSWPEQEVDIADGGTFTQDLFYLFKNYQKLLVLDAIRGGQEPGTIYRLQETDLLYDENQAISLHDIDLLDSLRMCELLGSKPELFVLGMEPYDMTTWEMELTETIQDHFPTFIQAVREEINRLLA